MKQIILVAIIGGLFALSSCSQNKKQSTEKASIHEVVAKVHKAADLVKQDKDKALVALRDNKSEFTWKDTYIFVIDFETGEVLANPAFREREGGNIREHKDWSGKLYGLELCDLASKGGGWMEYLWPLPGTDKGIRKLAYVYPVPGTSVLVCSGIYDENTDLNQLNKMYKEQQKPSQYAVIFEVYPNGSGRDEYLKIAARLKAELVKMPGFISIERFKSLSDEGKILSLSFWESEEAIANWRNLLVHRQGMQAGRDGLFKSYRIRVAKVVRNYTKDERKEAPEDSNAYFKVK